MIDWPNDNLTGVICHNAWMNYNTELVLSRKYTTWGLSYLGLNCYDVYADEGFVECARNCEVFRSFVVGCERRQISHCHCFRVTTKRSLFKWIVTFSHWWVAKDVVYCSNSIYITERIYIALDFNGYLNLIENCCKSCLGGIVRHLYLTTYSYCIYPDKAIIISLRNSDLWRPLIVNHKSR